MNKEILIAIGAGIASAMLSVSILFGAGFGGFLLTYFALLPILIIGLSAGPKSATYSAVAGIIAVISISSPLQGLLYGLSVALPSWLVVQFALKSHSNGSGGYDWAPIGNVLANLAALGAAMVLVAAVAYSNHEGGFTGAITEYLKIILEARIKFSTPGGQVLLMDSVVPYFPALTVGSWFVMVLVNAVIAQFILSRTGNNIRPTPSFSKLEAPDWLYWAAVLAASVGVVGSGDMQFIGRNLTIILAMPFFFIGLGIAHVLVRWLMAPGMALTIFYMMVLFLGWPMIVVAAFGFFEQWAQLKSKFAKPAQGPTEEEE